MEQKNSNLAILREPFVAGMDENLSPIMHRLWKLEGGAIYFCRSGWAHVTIDLKDYEIVENTQIVLLRERLSVSTAAAAISLLLSSDSPKKCFAKPACGSNRFSSGS